jgi:hypothetical protein
MAYMVSATIIGTVVSSGVSAPPAPIAGTPAA